LSEGFANSWDSTILPQSRELVERSLVLVALFS